MDRGEDLRGGKGGKDLRGERGARFSAWKEWKGDRKHLKDSSNGTIPTKHEEESLYLELPAAEISAATHCGGNSRRIPENQPQTPKKRRNQNKNAATPLLSGNFRRIPADFRRIPADFRRKSGGRKN